MMIISFPIQGYDSDIWWHIRKDVAASDMKGPTEPLLGSRVAAPLCEIHGISR